MRLIKYTTIGLRIPGYVAAEVFIDFTDELRHTETEEETEWQEQGAREAAWRLAKSILKIKGETKQHSSHLLKIGACLRNQPLNQWKEKLLSTPERRCT